MAADDLARCNAEIAEAERYLMQGGPEEPGAYVGLCDWVAERRLIEREIEWEEWI